MKDDVRIVIVDDNARFRDSIRLLINSAGGYTYVAGFDSGKGLEGMIKHLIPCVILMDIDMPIINGIEVVKKVREVDADVPILMLTSFEDEDKVFESICSGATGYILKNTPPADLLQSIKEVCEGGAPMTPSIARKVLHMFRQSQTIKPKPKEFDLSDRETQVLQLLVEGKSYKMIAADLGITFETVHSHIKRIYKELQVNSATEAVAKSLRSGLV